MIQLPQVNHDSIDLSSLSTPPPPKARNTLGHQNSLPGSLAIAPGSGKNAATAHAPTRDRRAELLEAAKAIVRESGFKEASVKAITARTGVSAGLLYSYASSADDLLCEVFRSCAGTEIAAIGDAVSSVTDSAALKLTTLVNTFSERALLGRSLARALLVEPVSRAIEIERQSYRRGYADMLTEIVVFGIQTGEFAPQQANVTASALTGAIGEAMAGPLSPFSGEPDPHSDEQVVASIREFCLRAVGARATAGS